MVVAIGVTVVDNTLMEIDSDVIATSRAVTVLLTATAVLPELRLLSLCFR